MITFHIYARMCESPSKIEYLTLFRLSNQKIFQGCDGVDAISLKKVYSFCKKFCTARKYYYAPSARFSGRLDSRGQTRLVWQDLKMFGQSRTIITARARFLTSLRKLESSNSRLILGKIDFTCLVCWKVENDGKQ